jgi:hypothetical protein
MPLIWDGVLYTPILYFRTIMENTNTLISKIVYSLKRYIGYQKKYIRLDLTEKLTLLLTALILGCIIFVIALIAVIFAGISLACAFQYLVSPWLSYAIVSCLFILICMLIYKKRQTLIIEPLTRFFAHLLLDSDNNNDHEENN